MGVCRPRKRPTRPIPILRWGGAAGADGRVFTGCNIENATFTPTNCAERTALFKAVSEGVTEFAMIAVVGAGRASAQLLSPRPAACAARPLYEFCGPEMPVLMAKSEDDFVEMTLGELLPLGFGPANLG